jgi:hypothetical protein
MNCLYITLFFNIVAGIVQTFIKSWKQLLYPRVVEVCRLLFGLRHDIVIELFPNEMFLYSYDSQSYHKQQQFICEFRLDVHLLR